MAKSLRFGLARVQSQLPGNGDGDSDGDSGKDKGKDRSEDEDEGEDEQQQQQQQQQLGLVELLLLVFTTVLANGKTPRLYVTGHSLGGSLVCVWNMKHEKQCSLVLSKAPHVYVV
jgi:hypothetical protein